MISPDGQPVPIGERDADPPAGPLVIDCDACMVRGAACSDCVVTFLLGGPPDDPEPRGRCSGAGGTVNLSAEELGALDTLADSGMVPPLRLVPLQSNDAHRPP